MSQGFEKAGHGTRNPTRSKITRSKRENKNLSRDRAWIQPKILETLDLPSRGHLSLIFHHCCTHFSLTLSLTLSCVSDPVLLLPSSLFCTLLRRLFLWPRDEDRRPEHPLVKSPPLVTIVSLFWFVSAFFPCRFSTLKLFLYFLLSFHIVFLYLSF